MVLGGLLSPRRHDEAKISREGRIEIQSKDIAEDE
jgi:hypothetical protein